MFASSFNEPILHPKNPEASVLKLGVNNRGSNPVMMVRPLTRVIGSLASVEHNQAAPKSKGSVGVVDNRFWRREFVISIRDQNRIDCVDRQVGIVRFPHTDANIVQSI